MTRQLLTTLLVATCILAPRSANAQQGFAVGYTDLGPTIGLGGIGSASMAFGGRFEHGFKQMASLGDGVVGIQVGADYYSSSSGGFTVSDIPIGVTANYHFVLDNKKIDPFVGLGLGYSIFSCNYNGASGDLCSNSALYFIGRAGARYFFKDRLALYGDVGAGAATLNVGLMFKLR